VKDVDVYADAKCVFSGEIPQLCSRESSIPQASTTASSFEEIEPSLSLSLLYETANSSQPNRNEIIKIDAKKISKNQFECERIEEETIETSQDKDSIVLSWLTSNSMANFDHQSEDLNFLVSKSKEIVFDSNQIPIDGKFRKISRRQKDKIDKETKQHNVVEIIKSDDEVRQSLQALQHAEKFNLGRLSNNTVLSFIDLAAKKDKKLENLLFDDSLDLVNENKNNAEFSHEAMKLKALTQEGDTKGDNDISVSARKLSVRSHKIDQVQEKIQNTLADLANIMSSLHSNKRETNISSINNASQIGDINLKSENAIRKSCLRIEIISSWGDSHYVGLNGIELFDENGKLLTLSKSIRREEQNNCIEEIKSYPW
jgi:hypothetical protein